MEQTSTENDEAQRAPKLVLGWLIRPDYRVVERIRLQCGEIKRGIRSYVDPLFQKHVIREKDGRAECLYYKYTDSNSPVTSYFNFDAGNNQTVFMGGTAMILSEIEMENGDGRYASTKMKKGEVEALIKYMDRHEALMTLDTGK